MKLIIEEDPFCDGQMAYHAYIPELEECGVSTWGFSKEEALRNIREVIDMVLKELIEKSNVF